MSARSDLQELGERILEVTRSDLYLSMRFIGPALGTLADVCDLTTSSIGTDGVSIRFNPGWLRGLFLERPQDMNRLVMHMLMHCLFRHMYEAEDHEDEDIWDIACDIAAEYMVDGMDSPAVNRVQRDFRADLYGQLKQSVPIMTAQHIYKYLMELYPDELQMSRLIREFVRDDHSFWARLPKKNESPDPEMPQPETTMSLPMRMQQENDWKKLAKRTLEEIKVGREASAETGHLDRVLSYTVQDRADYRDFLKRFMVIREESRIDPDSFDYAYYDYGMRMYGNMPLIEENEFCEVNRVQDLVIALDTSASTQAGLVRKFLNSTASILLSNENFFRRVNIHIICCDDRVQDDVVVTDVQQMKQFADGFHLKGGFGTDFRPVFEYVEELQKKKAFEDLKGLLYFTDGFGKYPEKPTGYDTAFVFVRDSETGEENVPVWAMKLYI